MTDQQRLFVNAYLGEARGNATQAARIAGYAEPNKAGWRIKNEPDVKNELERRLADSAMSANEVLFRLSNLAHATMADAFDRQEVGNSYLPTLNFQTMFDSGLINAVRKIKKVEFGTEIQLQDTVAALKLLMQYHGLLKQDESRTAADILNEVTDIVLAHTTDPDARKKIAAEFERIAESLGCQNQGSGN